MGNMKIIALAISLASLVHGEGLFLSNALDGVEIKLRGRDRGPDITQVELHIRPNEVAASGQIPTLEYKEEDGCWKEAPAKAGPTKRGQKKRWRLDLPAPCKTYKFRFALRSESQVTYSTEDEKTTTLVGEDALSNTMMPFSSTPCQTVEAVVKAVSGARKGPGARITFNTCKAEEDRDDATLDASFLFADFQEEECPSPNLPLCEPSPTIPIPQPVCGGTVCTEEISQFPTLLICLVAAGLLVFIILAIVFTIIIRKRQRSGIHHVQKS